MLLCCPAGMPKRTGEPNTKTSKRTDHHEKRKLYTRICINLGVEEDNKVSQKQAEKKLVEYVERKQAKLPADDPISCLLVEVTEYIMKCWRVQVSRRLFTMDAACTRIAPAPPDLVLVYAGRRPRRTRSALEACANVRSGGRP
jgi:hypothetical protein